MHARYYLCAIVGDGSSESPYRPAAADYPVSWAGGFDCLADGSPAVAECVCVVRCEDHAALAEDPALWVFPEDGPLDFAELEAAGFDLSGCLSWHDAVQRCGESRCAAFDIGNLDVL